MGASSGMAVQFNIYALEKYKCKIVTRKWLVTNVKLAYDSNATKFSNAPRSPITRD